MRALKTILIILAALFGIALIFYFVGDASYRIERSVTIQAPAETVFQHVNTLAAMDKWSPWNEHDPQMKKSIEGTDGTIGAKAYWEGNADVGKGSQEIVKLEPNKTIGLKLHFVEPFESHSNADVLLTPMGDSTQVVWAMFGENDGFMARVMSVFFNMDKMIGPEFQKGLGYLKTIVDQHQAEAAKKPAYEIATIDRPAMLYVGKREVVKMADLKDFYTKHFGAGMAAIAKAGVEPAGAPSGVFFEWNEKEMTFDMIAGIPVPLEAKAKLKGLDLYETPASKAYLIDYVGGYSGSMAAHMAMDAHMKANNVTMNANAIEEYITDPGQEPDSMKWHTNVIYLVK